MKHLIFAGLALMLAVGAAQADTCDSETLPAAFDVATRQIADAGQFNQALREMEGHIEKCPDHPWINFLGADLDLRGYNTVVQSNGGVANQEAASFLMRAFLRSGKFMTAPAEARQERRNLQSPAGQGNLIFDRASENRKAIIAALMQLARGGAVHPYIAAETPPVCGGWLNSDSQSIGYAIKAEADLIFLPFIEAAGEACRNRTERHLRLPLAIKAAAYSRLVDQKVVTDEVKVRQMLLASKDAEIAYLGGRDFDSFYYRSDADRLNRLLREHGTDKQAGFLARELWFTPDHIGSEIMAYSLAMAISEHWAAIAAEAAANPDTLAAGRARYTSFTFALMKEGREAGLEAETRAVLRKALGEVQSGAVSAPAMKDHDLPPQWLHDTTLRMLSPAGEGN